MAIGRLCLLGLLVLVVAACTTRYPLGMSESEWLSLSPEQQIDAREREERLNLEAAQQRAEQARQRAEAERREQEALEQRRREAGFGERIQCVLDGAQVRAGSRWEEAHPLGLDLIVGETADFRILERGSATRGGSGQASFDGQLVELCDRAGRHCEVIAGTSRDFQRGVRRQLEIDGLLRGELRCELAEPLPQTGRRR
ncbi:hypothetical protein CAI21_04710 [Alkalilimnicola ehrlichii]|uniref:Lipoprotein n=1 Tax=Alkalilimnicola ehrlichii TaxID=351052 RepID=A0A3E0X142_9GAMM|nr:hypothetical protein [Alkalilimnicola ehrlichii]RFA30809.1 hypothetical protein CAI21_04710 [Alkalilimnicola ehrlichii]RFA38385.1 hypothetical protein CAL65_06075 [Alkalilimnicola ehrlichii]